MTFQQEDHIQGGSSSLPQDVLAMPWLTAIRLLSQHCSSECFPPEHQRAVKVNRLPRAPAPRGSDHLPVNTNHRRRDHTNSSLCQPVMLPTNSLGYFTVTFSSTARHTNIPGQQLPTAYATTGEDPRISYIDATKVFPGGL